MTDDTVSFHDEPATAGPLACSRCGTPISQYWSVEGKVCCERCMHDLMEARTSSDGAARRVGKALAFGLGGMLAGAIVWYAVAKFADLQLGLIAILLGWLVGKGIQYGSERRGGIGYQVMAVVITYLGIGFASVPFVLEGATQGVAQSADSLASDSSLVAAVPADSLSDSATTAELGKLDSAIAAGKELDHDATGTGPALLMGVLALLMLAATIPVLVVIHGGSLITGIIYGIALYESWKFSRGIPPVVSGPHQVGAAS